MYVPLNLIYRAGRDAAKAGNRRQRQQEFQRLLGRSYVVNSAAIDGLDARPVEVHARAVQVIRDESSAVANCIKISGVNATEETDIFTGRMYDANDHFHG